MIDQALAVADAILKHTHKKNLKPIASPVKGFHLTVVAHPTGEIDMQHDLRMAKAALLYADSVTLCSPTASMLLHLCELESFTLAQKLDFIDEVGPTLASSDCKWSGLHKLKNFLSKVSGTPTERHFRRQALRGVNEQWVEIRRKIDSMAEESGLSELKEAIESGSLSLSWFSDLRSRERVVREFVDTAFDAVGSSNTHPLLDVLSGNIVKLGLQEGSLGIGSASKIRVRNSALASNLLRRLPAFDDVSMGDLLEVRHELCAPLVRFRAALMDYCSSIESLPWEAGFDVEIDTLYHQRVAPAVMEIEEAMKSHGFVKKLLQRIAAKPLVVGGSVIGMALTQSAQWSSVLQVVTAGTVAASVIYDAWSDVSKDKKETSQKQLFFYYAAGKQMAALA